MRTKGNIQIVGVILLALVVIIFGAILSNSNKGIDEKENPDGASKDSIMTEDDAQKIAKDFCIKEGETLSFPGNYNEVTKTWWFDANLKETNEGCNPACVVSEETKTAEINWRCTGLLVPPDTISDSGPNVGSGGNSTARCGIENCHGLDISCGPNVAEMCTMMYQAGDRCRQFANCEIRDGQCRLAQSNQFESCKNCVTKCENDFLNNPEKIFSCESMCGE